MNLINCRTVFALIYWPWIPILRAYMNLEAVLICGASLGFRSLVADIFPPMDPTNQNHSLPCLVPKIMVWDFSSPNFKCGCPWHSVGTSGSALQQTNSLGLFLTLFEHENPAQPQWRVYSAPLGLFSFVFVCYSCDLGISFSHIKTQL